MAYETEQQAAGAPAAGAPGGESDAGLRQFALRALAALSQPYQTREIRRNDKWWCGSVEAIRAHPKAAAAVRAGRLLWQDWWRITYLPLLFFLWSSIIIGSFLLWYFLARNGSARDISPVWYATTWAGVIVFGTVLYNILSIWLIRRRFARGLAAQDLLRRIYEGADPLAAAWGVLWKPLRFFLRTSDEPEEVLQTAADNLERCLWPRHPALRWERLALLVPWACFMSRFTQCWIKSMADIEQITPLTDLLLIIMWWSIMIYVTLHYHRLIAREHWMLDIYDRYLAKEAPGGHASMNIHAEAGDGV